MTPNKILRALSALMAGILLLPAFAACNNQPASQSTGASTTAATTFGATTQAPTEYPTTPQTPSVKQLSWEKGQIFPTFPAATGKIDGILADGIADEERIAITCLQGLVNAHETRLVLLMDNVRTWANTYDYDLNVISSVSDRYATIKKYAAEVSGVVLYSGTQARTLPDVANLATTIANVHQAIPITENLYKVWVKRGIKLPVIADITENDFKSRVDVYQYLYENYWEQCDQRILFIQGSNLPQMRDLASATSSAVIYLSCDASDAKELKLMKKFLADMIPGESILMGWNGQEKELMTVAAQYGLSCVPCDFFSAPSLFAQDIDVKINSVPDMPALENKIYIAFYFSDGDNIQYNMNAMKEYWDNSASQRGKIPLNWTISPALLEVAPGMMNYYYQSATEKECFVCGPSGLGYTVPVNTFGPNIGNNFRNDEKFTAFVDMTNRYLAETGLRTVTIWDNLTTKQRQIYTKQGSYLYGLTVQHFTNGSLDLGYTGVTNDMLVQQMTPAYFAKNAEGTTKLTELGEVDRAVKYLGYDGSAPIFISVQVSVWAFHNVKEVIDWEQYLSDKYAAIYGEDVVEFVRADHYFNLYNQANGLPYDLTLRSDLSVSATSGADSAVLTIDGTPETVWEAIDKGQQSLTYDLGGRYSLSEISVFFAGMEGDRFTASDNAKGILVEVSTDGETWTAVATVSDNTVNWLCIPFAATEGSYLRLTVTDAGASGVARIADVNILGKTVK